MIEIKRSVVDATVAAKWFLKDESDAAKADDLLIAFINRKIDLHVPAIFQYEVVGALKKACTTTKNGQRRIELQDAIGSVRELFSLPFQIHSAE